MNEEPKVCIDCGGIPTKLVISKDVEHNLDTDNQVSEVKAWNEHETYYCGACFRNHFELD